MEAEVDLVQVKTLLYCTEYANTMHPNTVMLQPKFFYNNFLSVLNILSHVKSNRDTCKGIFWPCVMQRTHGIVQFCGVK